MRDGTQPSLLAIFISALLAASCGGGYSSPSNPPPVTIQLSATSLTATQDGAPASLGVTLVRPAGNANSVTLSIASLPTGASTQITSPGTGNAGTIVFNGQGAAAGTYQVTVNASDGVTSTSASFTLVIAIVTTVQNSTNMILGVNGKLPEFMSTSFQPAEWDYKFFQMNQGATTTLNNLRSQHIRLQPISGGTPQKTATTWDFSTLDAILDPVISVADKSPELQVAVAPAFMRKADGTFVDPTYAQFAQYCANLVKYYNTSTGFVDQGGTTHVHNSTTVTPITWWGIFNEPNINQVPASEYPKLYNAVVPAMQAAGSVVPLKFVAVELADFSSEPQNYLPPFVSGVTTQVDALATHYYSTCKQSDPDTSLFGQITQTFVPHVQFIYSVLKNSNNPALVNVPVWVTENNVNADFDKGGGISACNAPSPFVLDKRGTSAFFAAWRPYVFSQLGKVGNQALYHWDFDADQQYGEVDFNTGKTYLSYWVDYYLEKFLGTYAFCPPVLTAGPQPETPIACPLPPASILKENSTESSTVEVLATLNAADQVAVMIANHAVHSPSDNNGPGDPRTVVVDLSSFICTAGGSIPAQLITIDANTDPSAGPTAVSVTASPRIAVTLNGYGVAFLVFSTCGGGTGCVCPLSAVN